MKKPFAAFTIVRNEPFFLRLWCGYYAKAFGEENLYVLDNSSDDSSVDIVKKRWPKINVKSVPSDVAFAWGWTTDVIKSFQASALNAYEVVVYADADEFLVPSQPFNSFKEYCEAFRTSSQQWVRAEGWAVIHQIDVEPILSLDTSAPLQQRHAVWRAPQYDKTLVSKVPLKWAKGLHTIYDETGRKLSDAPRDQRLSLIHLRDIDINVLHQRSIDRRRMIRFTDKDGFHSTFHGSTNRQTLEKHFRTLQGLVSPGEYIGERTDVPEQWKRLLRDL